MSGACIRSFAVYYNRFILKIKFKKQGNGRSYVEVYRRWVGVDCSLAVVCQLQCLEKVHECRGLFFLKDPNCWIRDFQIFTFSSACYWIHGFESSFGFGIVGTVLVIIWFAYCCWISTCLHLQFCVNTNRSSMTVIVLTPSVLFWCCFIDWSCSYTIRCHISWCNTALFRHFVRIYDS